MTSVEIVYDRRHVKAVIKKVQELATKYNLGVLFSGCSSTPDYFGSAYGVNICRMKHGFFGNSKPDDNQQICYVTTGDRSGTRSPPTEKKIYLYDTAFIELAKELEHSKEWQSFIKVDWNGEIIR